jgi:hypothetical protein
MFDFILAGGVVVCFVVLTAALVVITFQDVWTFFGMSAMYLVVLGIFITKLTRHHLDSSGHR